MKLFLSGIFTALSLIVSLYFFRCYWRSRDGLFACFAASFALLAAERILITSFELKNEIAYEVTIIRLFAFLLLLAGIVYKNRGRA